MSFHNFLIKKSYIDMDYLYGKLSKAQGLFVIVRIEKDLIFPV